MENLPEVQPDAPPAPPRGETRELVIYGSEIYLPDSGRFSPDDAEFASIVNEILPEYAASLSEEALRRPRGYSAWAILLILLFFGLLGTMFFSLQPRVTLQETALKVPPPENTSYVGSFSRQYQDAMEYVKSRRYEDARRALEPVVCELLRRGEAGPKNEPIFYSYFELFDHLPWDAEAREQLEKLIGLDRQYRWELFDVLCRLEMMGGEEPGKCSEAATQKSLQDALKLVRRLRKQQQPDLLRLLDLCECHFELKLWRLKNRPKADDEYGLEDRERAWKIASKYPQDTSFYEIRRYLIRQLILDDPGGNYIFNGEEYWWNSRLERFLYSIELEYSGGQKVKQ